MKTLSPIERLVACLAEHGVGALHVDALELGTAPDDQIMAAAGRLGRVVLTRDRDYGALLAKSRAGGPSIVLLRSDRLVRSDEQATRIASALREHGRALAKGAIVVVEDADMRVRLLPL